jgi:hypothetical protein
MHSLEQNSTFLTNPGEACRSRVSCYFWQARSLQLNADGMKVRQQMKPTNDAMQNNNFTKGQERSSKQSEQHVYNLVWIKPDM